MGYNIKNASQQSSGNTEFTALPMGRYTVTVDDTEVTTSSAGNEMIKISFTVSAGEYKNRKLWHNLTFTDKSLPVIASFLKACGSSVVDEEDVSIEEISQDLIGRTVTAYTEPGKTINGNPRNDLKNWKAVDTSSEMDSLPDDEIFS